MTSEKSTPKKIKSLKAQKPYNVMLSRQENEQPIIEIPLRKNKTLEITNLKLSVFDSKGIKLAVPMNDVRSITPLNKKKIRIQYYTHIQNVKYGAIPKRKYVDYDLEKPKVSALQLCHKIKNEHEKLNTFSKNDKGLLLLQPQEHIVITYQDVDTSEGKGMLCVTNVGLALETDKGIIFDVPYERMLLVTDHKKDKIRVLWQNSQAFPQNLKHSFDFKIPKKLDRSTASSVIRQEFANWRQQSGWEFVQLEKKYGNISYDELYNLARSKNPEIERYFFLHAIHTFGFLSPDFTFQDTGVIGCCKLAGLDVSLIADVSPEELEQRKESRQKCDLYEKLLQERKLHIDEVESMEKDCKNTEDFKKLQDTKDYKEHRNAITELEQQDIFKNWESYRLKIHANSIQAVERRSRIIYKKWCETHYPLQNFTDWYDDKWITYLLEKLNTPQGHDPVIPDTTLTYDFVSDALKNRNRNRTTLSNFAAPEDIPPEQVWNNCWYDKKHKMYYVADDNMTENLSKHAESDPDHSQTMMGRRVWGFAEDQVEMFCGFPSIKHDTSRDTDEYDNVTTVISTGEILRVLMYKTRNYILPILKDEDITEEMALKYGNLIYQSAEMKCLPRHDGTGFWGSPKLLEFFAKKYSFADIPLNEVVRRNLFTIEIGPCLNAQIPMA
jgi:hypothetical protein